MTNIDIRQFVDINILHHTSSIVNATRDTTVLFTHEGGQVKGFSETYSTMDEFVKGKFIANAGTASNLYKYGAMYFANFGVKLKVIAVTMYSDKVSFVSEVKDIIASLDNRYIVYAYSGNNYSFMEHLAAAVDDYGINQKIILASYRNTEQLTNVTSLQNFAYKVSSQIGTEMAIAAYLSKINIYGVNTVQDYNFTKESTYDDAINISEDISNDELTTILEKNGNVTIFLSNADRNVGGNMSNGLDLVNQFVLIVLHQTLTERVLSILVDKLKNQSGLAAIHSVMSSELLNYLKNGYLTTDKIWTDNTLSVKYNGTSYTIIAKNEQLSLGYKIVILPYTSLTNEDKVKHKTPPIYVVLADSYGIRNITINGEIL